MANLLNAEERKQAVAVHTATVVEKHTVAVVDALRAYVEQSQRGVAPALRRVLSRDGVDLTSAAQVILAQACAALITGKVALTACGARCGRALDGLAPVAEPVEGVEEGTRKVWRPNAEQRIILGAEALDKAGHACGLWRVARVQVDRPEKVEGGLQLVVGYELRANGDADLDALIEAAKVGMPQLSTERPKDWTAYKDGGHERHTRGMIHGRDEVFKDLNSEAAPRLFEAVNFLQGVAFYVNPVTAKVVQEYSENKAFAWLRDRFIAEGMEPVKAETKAREMARL